MPPAVSRVKRSPTTGPVAGAQSAATNGWHRGGTGVVILGSTGSIGVSALAVLRHLPQFRVVGLAAGRDVDALERQARTWKPRFVAMHDEAAARELKRRLGSGIEVLSGPEGVVEAAGRPEAGVVVSA